jgi:phosphotransferase system IIA component
VLRERARSLATPVVITNMGKVETMDVTSEKSVRAGQDVVLTVMLKANAQ